MLRRKQPWKEEEEEWRHFAKAPADLEKVPQLILNYTTGSADGISIAFLTVWLIGDITNLAGASPFSLFLSSLSLPNDSRWKFCP